MADQVKSVEKRSPLFKALVGGGGGGGRFGKSFLSSGKAAKPAPSSLGMLASGSTREF